VRLGPGSFGAADLWGAALGGGRRPASPITFDSADHQGSVTFVPLDLAGESLREGLVGGGLDVGAPAFVGWLGVTMYLEREALERTVAVLGGLAAGSELVVDYMLPAGLRDAAGDSYAEQVGQASADRGEPWLSLFSPQDMGALLAAGGFGAVRDVGQREMIPAALWERSDALRPVELSRIAHGVVGG
jgi:O-methyltransferase involved in polyketide biosynthesis